MIKFNGFSSLKIKRRLTYAQNFISFPNTEKKRRNDDNHSERDLTSPWYLYGLQCFTLLKATIAFCQLQNIALANDLQRLKCPLLLICESHFISGLPK